MARVYPEELEERVRHAVEQMTAKGYILKNDCWLEEDATSNKFCACPLTMVYLYENQDDAAFEELVLYLQDGSYEIYQFIANKLAMDSAEVTAFVSGFDSISDGVDVLPEYDPEHEMEIMEVGELLREEYISAKVGRVK